MAALSVCCAAHPQSGPRQDQEAAGAGEAASRGERGSVMTHAICVYDNHASPLDGDIFIALVLPLRRFMRAVGLPAG